MTEKEAAMLVEALGEDGYEARAVKDGVGDHQWGVEVEPLEPLGEIRVSDSIRDLLTPGLGAWLHTLSAPPDKGM